MKKITSLFVLLAAQSMISQDFSTGVIPFSNTSGLAYSAEIATDSEKVTLTLVGPSDRWLGIGFGTQAMSSGDCVIFNGTSLSDRTFVGNQLPTVDAVQTWTLVSNEVVGNVRTVVGQRALNSGQPNNYVFTNSADPISLIWARGATASFSISNHGGSNRGATMSQFLLSNNQFNAEAFKIYPVPAQDFVTLQLPDFVDNATVVLYDFSGKQILKSIVSKQENTINTSEMARGSYVVQLVSDAYSFTRILILN
jgi:hypothetical protein